MRWWFLLLLPLALLVPAQNKEYAGSESCASCHQTIYDKYQSVSMSQTFDRVAAARPIEDWTKNNRLYHEPSNQYFLMTSRDGRFYQRRYQLDGRGNEVNSLEQEIDYTIGSGKHERDYLFRSDAGELLQFPVVWYAAENKWGMAPGYDRPDHENFSRKINYRCVFCHNAYPDVKADDARYESQISLFPKDMGSGVDCERCHGPGGRHIQERTAATIVNPARLNRKLQMDVCMQCHLETTSSPLPNSVLKVGRPVFSYRPGQPLEDYAATFDFPARSGHDDDFNIVHQAYRLRKSQCFIQSSMTCTTCHDPHSVPANTQAFFQAKCATCHTMKPEHGQDCAGCHMPKRRTDDIVHVVMTDHYIQRRPPKNLLEAKTERRQNQYRGALSFYLTEPQQDLYMGMALARGADPRRAAQLLERAILSKTPASPEPYLDLATAYTALGQRARAIASYKLGLALDPSLAEAHYNLGLALFAEGRNQDAAESLREATRLKPGFADAHVALGIVESELGNLDSARKSYLQAVSADPMNVLAPSNLALLESRAGHPEQAAMFFKQVLRIQPRKVPD